SGTCPDTNAVTINITLSPSAVFTYSGPYCQGGANPLPVFGTSASGGVFTSSTTGLVFANASTGEIDLVNSTAGTYTVINTIAASGGCSMAVDSFSVTINALPNVDAGLTQSLTCTSSTAILNGSSSTTGAIFSWTGGTIDSGGSTATPTVSATGTYTLTVTSSVCSNTDTVSVINNLTPPNADAGAGQALTCTATSVTLSGTSTTAGATYSWSGPGVVSGASTATATANATGVYIVTITDPSNGCTSTDVVSVTSNTVVPNASAGTTQTINCTTTTVSLDGSSTTVGATYSWSGGTIVSGGTTASPTVSAAGTYTVTVTDPANGCTATSTVAVTGNSTPPVANAGSAQALDCATPTVSLAGSSTTAGVTYSWSGGTIVSGGTTASPIVSAAGTYTVTVTDPSNGCTATSTVVVTGTVVSPVASFSANPASGTAPLTVDFTNSSSNATTYLWSFGDGTFSSATSPSDIYNTPGTYIVTLIASIGTLCADTAQMTIVVFDNLTIVIPNVFSPNGDANNDVFTVTSTGVADFNAEIYDRWGLKLAEWNNIATGWDGRTSSGKLVPDGTYYYLFTVKAQDGTDHLYKGFVQVVK
ncbi:MAG TPA: gliding motility-associated C-terminal domain-containing protein, partial [Bacteroidia bacterium]